MLQEVTKAPEIRQIGQPHRPSQPRRDFLTQTVVGGQSDGVKIACLFEPCIERRDRIYGIGPEEPLDVTPGIPSKHRVQNIPPAMGTVDGAIAQGLALLHAELVEQNLRVIAGAIARPVQAAPS